LVNDDDVEKENKLSALVVSIKDIRKSFDIIRKDLFQIGFKNREDFCKCHDFLKRMVNTWVEHGPSAKTFYSIRGIIGKSEHNVLIGILKGTLKINGKNIIENHWYCFHLFKVIILFMI
jgi:hypothetical protein